MPYVPYVPYAWPGQLINWRPPVLIGPIQENSKDELKLCRIARTLENPVFNPAIQPVCLRTVLNFGNERGMLQLRASQINLHPPTWIIDRLNLDTVNVLRKRHAKHLWRGWDVLNG